MPEQAVLMDDFGQAEQADDHRDEGDADMKFSFSKVKRMAPVVPETPTVARRMPTPAQRMPLRMGGARNAAHYGQGQQDVELHCSTGPIRG